MIQNLNERKPGEGIWWKSAKYKRKPDISDFCISGRRTVSKAEKEAWIRALSTTLAGTSSSKTTVKRTVSKAEKEAWEKVMCEALVNAFIEEIRPKLYTYLTEILYKWNEEWNDDK